MKKGDRNYIGQGGEYLYRLSLRKDFQSDALQAREKMASLENKYRGKKNSTAKYIKEEDKIVEDTVRYFMEKYKIPNGFLMGILAHVYRNNTKLEPAPWVPNEIFIAEKMKRSYTPPFVKIVLMDGATKETAIKFIDKNWGEIAKLLEEQRGYKITLPRKQSTHRERDILIRKLLQTDKKDLLNQIKKMTGDPSYFSNNKVSMIVKMMHLHGFKVTDALIRKHNNN